VTALSDASVLAIDIGGTKIAFADVEGDQIRNRHQVKTPRTGRGSDLIDAIDLEIRRRKSTTIAVATTGIVSRGRLTALNPQTLPIEDGFHLGDHLQALTGRMPLVVNDAQAAAWGEYRYGSGRGARNFMFVTVSTGVGGGLVLDGRLHFGIAGLAGHVGHMAVGRTETPCGCGRQGCLETIASGSAIARRFREVSGREAATVDVFEAAARGDIVAERIIDEAAAALAEAVANIIAAVDLDAIAIGGGVGLAPGFLDRICLYASRLPQVFRRRISAALAGPDAGLLGVARLLKENFII
jgi:N-acylmannosamine kinase